MKRRPTDSNTEGKKDTGMLKYIRNQVNFCFSCYFYNYHFLPDVHHVLRLESELPVLSIKETTPQL